MYFNFENTRFDTDIAVGGKILVNTCDVVGSQTVYKGGKILVKGEV